MNFYNRNRLLFLAVFFVLVTSATSVQAVPITYNFQINVTDGPLAPASESGFFTFDDSIIPGGGGFLYEVDLFSDLEFTWNGIQYDETTANTGRLSFDAAGDLQVVLFGNQCGAGGCVLNSGLENWAVSNDQFLYSSTEEVGFFGGSSVGAVTLSQVPEPAPLALMAIGLAGLGFARRNKKA